MVVVRIPGLDSDPTVAVVAVNMYVDILHASSRRRGDDALMRNPSLIASGLRVLEVLRARNCRWGAGRQGRLLCARQTQLGACVRRDQSFLAHEPQGVPCCEMRLRFGLGHG